MKDSKGREISLTRLDMLTDEEIDQLKGDSWDDYCWKSGNQYARMVHEFCVIEQDKRIRQQEKEKIEQEKLRIRLEMDRRANEMQGEINKALIDSILNRGKPKKEPEEGPKEIPPPFIGTWNDRWKKTGRTRERLTGTE